ncbi:MAG: hypothetical protein ACRD2W_20935 [Acidimicrobiales bacterium]
MPEQGVTVIDPQVAQQVKAFAAGRIGMGAVAVVAPKSALKRWLGPDGTRPDTRLLARMLGARDVAIGIGTLFAVKHQSPVRGWLEAGALADAGDLAASVLGLRGGLPRRPVLGTAGAALAGVAWSRRLVSRLPSS